MVFRIRAGDAGVASAGLAWSLASSGSVGSQEEIPLFPTTIASSLGEVEPQTPAPINAVDPEPKRISAVICPASTPPTALTDSAVPPSQSQAAWMPRARFRSTCPWSAVV